MAYIDTEREIVVLFPHKTGTNTIRTILKDHGKIPYVKLHGVWSHPTLDYLKAEYPKIYSYDVYAFYREPVERFMSFVAYNYRQFPLMEPFTTVHDYIGKYGFFAPQTRWLTHHTADIQLLDFRKFDSELRKLLNRLGLPTDIEIPKLNKSDNKKPVSELAPDEIEAIKEVMKDEVDFFASKRIKFNV
jgi:hypothetical protein